MENLTTIFDKYNSDKNSSFHNYCRQYESIMRDYRTKDISFLELGVLNGESIKMWREVFPNAKRIVGVDITPECKQYENADKSIFIEIGDATNSEFIKYINEKYGPFDIILDDASHINKDIILSFEKLFPLMNDNGLYIVEDTHAYRNPLLVDSDYLSHLVYFGQYFPYLSQWRYNSTEGIRDHCQDPFKIIKKASNIFEATIDMITYGNSFIAINKKIKHHWL